MVPMNPTEHTVPTVMTAMSGGVDSSVCAALLCRWGFDVCGVTCKMFGGDVMSSEEMERYGVLDAFDDAKAASRKLGITHYTFNYKKAFAEGVIEPFCQAYLTGRTPNPCIDCNGVVKFGALHQRRTELGLDYLGTGHYARIAFDEPTGRWNLLRATCREKDQSYMLYRMTQDQLAHTLFPLGELDKGSVRHVAEEEGLEVVDKEESQDICFVPEGNHVAFIERWCEGARADQRTQDAPDAQNAPSFERAFCEGPIMDGAGRRLGMHQGLIHYTIGQRKGIGIASEQPLYVIAKDVAANTLIVGPKEDLLVREVRAMDLNFIAQAPEEMLSQSGQRVFAKTSYRQEPRLAAAYFDGEELKVVFDEPTQRPASGQALVLYDGRSAESVLCGGTIL